MATPSPASRDCAAHLRAAVSGLTRHLRASLPSGVSLAQLSVLGLLYRRGPLTPTEAARHEGVRLQSLTRLLADLEASGWIARTAHATDGRQSLLSLTRAGTRLLSDHVRRREASLTHAIEATLSATEQSRLREACVLLGRVAEALGEDVAARANS
jgi:DNA-binding MarR family transcriptional regulator